MADKQTDQDRSKPKPAQESEAEQAQEGSLSMMEGVRRALAALGQDANSLDVQGYLKEHFDLEMSRDQITKYKSHLRNKPGTKKDASQPQSDSPAEGNNGRGGVRLEDLQKVKALLSRVGVDKLRALIDLLAP